MYVPTIFKPKNILTRFIQPAVMAALSIVSTACVNEAEFAPDHPPALLVVDGRITTNEGPQTLRLSEVAAYGQRRGDPVSGAVVTLSDDQGGAQRYEESAEEAGLYLLAGVRGEVGRTYELDIRLPDGRRYRSEPERLLPAPKVDSLSLYPTFELFQEESGTVQEKWFLNVSVHTALEPQTEGPYLRWEVETIHNFVQIWVFSSDLPFVCYVKEPLDPQQIRLFDGSGVSSRQAIDRFVGRRLITWVFEWKHYFNVYQSSLTERAFRYWSNIDRIANQAGTVFDPPPAAIRGNIYNPADRQELVLGYFGASAFDTARIFTTRPDLKGITILPYCGSSLERPSPLPRPCINCIELPKSTYERPDYF